MNPCNVQAVVRFLNDVMKAPVQASSNIERDLETHVRQFEVTFSLEPLARALREQISNKVARYHDARDFASFYNTKDGLQVAQADFWNGNYGLTEILRDDQHLYLHVQFVDQATGLPGTVDLRGKAMIVIAEPNGRVIVSSPITSVDGAQFDFAALRPIDYVAKMQPQEPKQ